MTPLELSASLFSCHERFSLMHLSPICCKHSFLLPELRNIVGGSKAMFFMQEAGKSLEGRSINRVIFGKGPVNVLLWSQMHGDEPTATLALMDIFSFLAQNKSEPWVVRLSESITAHFIPLLNPDGAERFRRFTAAGIDMNRDARNLATPEANVLREAHQLLRPAFGFNLHDQGLSSVGAAPSVTALSLLAPAVDEARSMPMVRIKAMRVGALIARVVNQFAAGHIATYDDAFEPRAFGDTMQRLGTSTILIEAGQWPEDPEKKFIRKMNFVSILTALHAIGDGSYQDVELEHYTGLVQNGKRMFDLMVRNLVITRADGWTTTSDVGLLIQPQGEQTSEVPNVNSLYAVKEIGDLKDFGGLSTFDASARTIQADAIGIDKCFRLKELKDLLQL